MIFHASWYAAKFNRAGVSTDVGHCIQKLFVTMIQMYNTDCYLVYSCFSKYMSSQNVDLFQITLMVESNELGIDTVYSQRKVFHWPISSCRII